MNKMRKFVNIPSLFTELLTEIFVCVYNWRAKPQKGKSFHLAYLLHHGVLDTTYKLTKP